MDEQRIREMVREEIAKVKEEAAAVTATPNESYEEMIEAQGFAKER